MKESVVFSDCFLGIIMGSKIQQIRSSTTAINQGKANIKVNVNEMVYDIFPVSNFHLHEFSNYGDHQQQQQSQSQSYTRCSSNINTRDLNNLKYVDPNMNLTSSDVIEVPYNMITTSTTTYKVVNYNNNSKIVNFDQNTENYHRQTHSWYRAGSPKDYESDESCNSYSSRDTSDNNVIEINKLKRCNTGDNTITNQNENYDHRSPIVFPNLYQPNINYHKHRLTSYPTSNSNRHRHNSNKNSDIMVRRAHGLMERFKSRAYKLRVIANPPGLLNNGPWDQLNQAIWDVFISKIQKEETYINKLNLWKQMFLYIRKFLSSYGLFLVGSTMSGFALDGSDIDMCLLTKPFNNDPRVDSLHHLSHLKQLLMNGGIASSAELIMAKVPILKFKNKETGFEVDLNCNNAVGIRNTHLLHAYAQLDWRVRPLVVIVKLWAQANKINDAKNMTISSYSWALMVIHYLQCGVTPAVLPCLHEKVPGKFNSDIDHQSMDVQEEIDSLKDYESENHSCLGDLLIGFFHYYSYFDYSQFAISVRAGTRLPIDECRFLKTPKNDPNQWKCLCIEEPFNFSNTARSVFDPDVFKVIKEIIYTSYKELARKKILNYILPVSLNRQR